MHEYLKKVKYNSYDMIAFYMLLRLAQFLYYHYALQG